MIAELADRYAAAGDPVDAPRPAGARASPEQAASRLLDAVRAGELDEVDALAASLLPTVSPAEAVGLLGEGLVTSLAAAGHAPIGFALLGRVRPMLTADPAAWPAAQHRPAARLAGALARRRARPSGDARRLYDARAGDAHARAALAATSSIPLMSQVQDRGVAAELLAPVLADRFDTAAAARTLTGWPRGAWCTTTPARRPTGGRHALTMPQAVMALAGAGVTPRTALAVAATFTLGFRAAHGTVELPEAIEPGPAPDATWTDCSPPRRCTRTHTS